MSLIGVLTDKSHEAYIMNGLQGIVSREQMIFLRESSIHNLKNIKFQTFLIGKEIRKNKEAIKEMAKKAEYLIFNIDIVKNVDLLDDLSVRLITYGFNSKATMTTSSIEDGKMMVCLQRAIQNEQGEEIEPQEQKVDNIKEINGYAVMEEISLKLLYS